MSDLVSVIVPVYNVEQYLDMCLESIVNQTYQNLEIIVVDDGSTDKSGMKCDEWAKRDPRIRVIHQENRGLSGARNTALDICRGSWIVFVDSDDSVDKKYVEVLYGLTQKYRVKLAQCENDVVNSLAANGRDNAADGVMNSVEFLLSRQYQMMAWAKIYARELFEKERYPLGKIHEDVALTYKLIYSAGKVAYTNEILYRYSTRTDSINARERFYLRRLDILQFRKEQLIFFRDRKEQKLADKALRAYAYELLVCYEKTVRILKRPDIAKRIQKEYQQIWKELKFDREISGKTKVLLGICCYVPTLWSRIV